MLSYQIKFLFSSLGSFYDMTKLSFSFYFYYIVFLTFTTLYANSADDKLMTFFLFFFILFRKQNLTLHANCLHWRQFALSVKCLLTGEKKKKKKYFKMSSAENFNQRAKR